MAALRTHTDNNQRNPNLNQVLVVSDDVAENRRVEDTVYVLMDLQ